MKVLSDLKLENRTVFLRADLDVPLDEKNLVSDTRLQSFKKTAIYLLNKNSKIVIAGHIGRPEKPDEAFSTKRLILPLQEILGKEISFKENFDQKPTEIIALAENLRFWSGETTNDSGFAQTMAKVADVYVNEAFGVCHRVNASMVALPAILPHAAGLHLEEEVETLTKVLEAPIRPFVAIVGGAKIETKVPVIENLAKVADFILVGGALPLEINAKGIKFGEKVVVATLTENKKDIDAATINKFCRILKSAGTIVWNGPLGLFEEGFTHGSLVVADTVVSGNAKTIVGGAETTELLGSHNLLSRFSFVSSGGGAMLEFLAGKELPGLKALE